MTLTESFLSILRFIETIGNDLKADLFGIGNSLFADGVKERLKRDKRLEAVARAQERLKSFLSQVEQEREGYQLSLFKVRSPLEASGNIQDKLLASQLRQEAFSYVSLSEKPETVLDEAISQIQRPDYAFSLISWGEKRYKRLPWNWAQRIHEELDVPLGAAEILDALKVAETLRREATAWVTLVERDVWTVTEHDKEEATRLGIGATDFVRIQAERMQRAVERSQAHASMQV